MNSMDEPERPPQVRGAEELGDDEGGATPDTLIHKPYRGASLIRPPPPPP